MASNSNNGNINWQEWLAKNGLDQAGSGQQAPAASPAPAAQGAHAASQTTNPAAHTAPAATTPAGTVAPATSTTATTPAANVAPAATTPMAATTPVAAAPAATASSATTAPATPTASAATTAPAATTAQNATYAAPAAPTKAQQKQQARAAKAAAKQAAKANKQGGGGLKTFALGFLGAACAFAIGTGVLGANGFFAKPVVTETVSEGGTVVLGSDTNTTVQAENNNTESLAEAVASKVLPSIVGIDVYAKAANDYSSFWGGGSTDSETLSGLGSGVVISKDGYILTNYHVVEGASKLMATVGGEEREATVVGTDESSDLAVIKVEANDLVPVEIGSSDGLKPGQWVMTLGSPFGLEQSVATGIVSATSRTVVVQNSSIYSYGQQVQPSIYSNMIQTDAAINPGNSGGALVDENGKLIGINSVIESYSGSYSGVGFAIPVDYAMNIATQIIDGKTPTHAQLGVSATTIDKDIADRYDLGSNSGAYINKVYDDSGAQAAGLEQGDIIIKIGGVTVDSSTDLIGQIRAHNPGETVTVTIVRGTETMDVEVTLGSDENTVSYTEQDEQQYQQMPYGDYHNWGQDGQSGQGYNLEDLFGNGGEEGGQGFSYEDLQELFNYFNRR